MISCSAQERWRKECRQGGDERQWWFDSTRVKGKVCKMVETCYEVMSLEQVSANKKTGGWAGGDESWRCWDFRWEWAEWTGLEMRRNSAGLAVWRRSYRGWMSMDMCRFMDVVQEDMQRVGVTEDEWRRISFMAFPTFDFCTSHKSPNSSQANGKRAFRYFLDEGDCHGMEGCNHLHSIISVSFMGPSSFQCPVFILFRFTA